LSDDKPGHILEISDALGRDVDRYQAGNGPAPPIEAFIHDDVLEEISRNTGAAATVSEQDLVPITKAEAARRVTFDGEHLPRVPSTRRVLPAPFRRERISLDRHGRQWTECPVEKVQPGDVVPDVGRIKSAETVTRYEPTVGVPDVAVGMKVILTGVAGNRVAFDPGASVRAFRLAELWPPTVSPTSAAGSGSRGTATRRRASRSSGSTTTPSAPGGTPTSSTAWTC
jgi:hypothetical protein